MSFRLAILTSAPGGGAGIAAMRLYSALEEHPDCQPAMFDIEALGGPVPSDVALPRSLSNQRLTDTHFTIEYSGDVRGWLVALLSSFDAVNVHWSTYLISLGELDALTLTGTPVLFTFHDYYYFTGGCHYPAGCEGYLRECIGCPQVDVTRCDDSVIPINKAIKRRIFSRSNVHVASPSHYLLNQAISGAGIDRDRAHVIRNPYRPVPGLSTGAKKMGMPRIVLIADSLAERRKGMALALDVLDMAGSRNSFVVDVIGGIDETIETCLNNAPYKLQVHGRISEHSVVAKILSGADLILTCSFEDNWPNILVEAACYGCIPIVGPGHGCEEFSKEFGGYVSAGYSREEFLAVLESALVEIAHVKANYIASKVIKVHEPATAVANYLRVLGQITKHDRE